MATAKEKAFSKERSGGQDRVLQAVQGETNGLEVTGLGLRGINTGPGATVASEELR